MSIATDRKKYFWLAANDAVTTTEPEPSTFTDSHVTPCIDLVEYMKMFRAALDEVGTWVNPADNRGEFIYISGWWLGLLRGTFQLQSEIEGTSIGARLSSHGPGMDELSGFYLDPLAPEMRLVDVLKQKARLGVDVRVMGWVSFSLLDTHIVSIPFLGALINPMVSNALQNSNPGKIVQLNAFTMNSIQALRSEPALAKAAMLNVIGHPAGAIHVKGAVIGTKPDGATGKSRAIAFTGGLDLLTDRWADIGHVPQVGWDKEIEIPRWHDIQAAIEGPAAQGFYNHFRDMWNENLRRDAKRFNFDGERMMSYVDRTPAVPNRIVDQFLLTPTPVGPLFSATTHHVQSLRTIPTFKYHWYNCWPENPPVSYAPNGLFELRAAWRKAILAAEQYIYMEDQSYWSVDVMMWLNEALRAKPDLKVILVGSGQGDPNDMPFDDRQYLHESINVGLLGIGTATKLSATQVDRIRFFLAWGESVRSSDWMNLTTITEVSASEVRVETDTIWEGKKPIPADAFAKAHLFLFAIDKKSRRVIGNPLINTGQPLVFRLDPGATVPTKDTKVFLVSTYGLVVHAKVTLIDDKWAIIGSANVSRRSLYSDWEHSISFLDEKETAVRDFRSRLWSEHFHGNAADFEDLDAAIAAWAPAWAPAWGAATPAAPPMPEREPLDLGPPYLERVSLPLGLLPMSDEIRSFRDLIRDFDSRDNWGGCGRPPSEPSER